MVASPSRGPLGSPAFEIPEDELTDFCRRWQIVELSLFGSALGEELGPSRDVDLLVTFDDQARPTLLDMVRMQAELEAILDRPVDLLSRRAVSSSTNPLRREAILDSARVLYAA